MAKKIVRGITDVKTINNQDFDTNNVNDLLSDGQYNYIHRKKGENEEYHNLTDNIKTISSDNTELLAVTNNNKTTNTATLHPKHDAQKEQLLESTRNTITINHGTNGTAEKTTVDTNPLKVLEHENLLTGYGIRKDFSSNKTTLTMDTRSVPDGFDLNNFNSGLIRASYFTNAPSDNVPFYVVGLGTVTGSVIQIAFKRINSTGELNQMFIRTKMVGEAWSNWKQYGTDNDTLNTILAGKQDKLIAGTGITIDGNTVDTNPKKVLEHENLISDSEYITLNHETGKNTTHIQTAALKEQLEQLFQGISLLGDALINYFSSPDFSAVQHCVTSGDKTVVTFSFECFNAAETVITGVLKQQLGLYVLPNTSISNGALTITNDGTTMKLINSAPSENVRQHAAFTFYYRDTDSGEGSGGGDLPPIVGA